MPLIKRSISPVNVSRGCIPPNLTKDELQCVANGTMANLIRQLSSLSRHAEHIVGDIYHEAMKLDHKSNLLQQRIERLSAKIEQIDSNNEQASLEQLHMRKAFKSSMLVDQHTLDRATLPPALVEVYDKCDPPPNLDALNQYRDDPTNALSLYTNPGFFFDLWRKEMLKDMGDNRRKVKSPDGQKSPKKKRRPAEQQQQQPHMAKTNVHSRYSTSRNANMGALSFPEEYQAPQSLGLQLHRNHGYQPIQSSTPLVPPPGMSVRAPPMLIERNDVRSSVSPPRDIAKRDLPLPDMSILAIDDDDELPPPPPPLMHTSIVQHMPSPPQNMIQFVPSEGQQIPPPAPPPPPPPPPNLMAQTTAATFSSSKPKTESSINSATSAPQNADPRSDLLAQIRAGKDLRKTNRAKEEEEERKARSEHDVAAILRQRLEQVRTAHEDEEDSQGSAEYEDGEWD